MDLRGRLDLPRGLRNNNPGNLVITPIQWQGKVTPSQDSTFETFEDMFFGLRAMAMDIYGDWSKKGAKTIRKLIYQFAPPSENDTEAYIQYVSQITDIGPDTSLNLNDPDELAAVMIAMIARENGTQALNYISANDLMDAIAAMGKSVPAPSSGSRANAAKLILAALALGSVA